MRIESVFDPSFKPYGRVLRGYPVEGLLKALAAQPLPEGVGYVPRVQALHEAENAGQIGGWLFGGLPFELGWCSGHNTKLNCLEYHRDSEFNLGTEDFILLLARQDELEEGRLDTAKVKAFRVPRGTLIEVYATTLHYAPCQADADRGFRVLVALPDGTNTPYEKKDAPDPMDALLWARNKWLIAHPESAEAAQGAFTGLSGDNLDIKALL